MKTKLFIFTTAVLLTVVMAGCGSKKNNSTATDSSAQSATADTGATGTDTSTSTNGKTVQPKVSGSLKKRPHITTPAGTPPSVLIKKDIKKGSGKVAKAGDNLTMQYDGISWSTGQEFDASWNRGQPFKFKLGQGAVIQGWDQGIEGMRAGGRRLLIIPPDLGYGAQGQGGIAPNETLVFVVDLVKVSK